MSSNADLCARCGFHRREHVEGYGEKLCPTMTFVEPSTPSPAPSAEGEPRACMPAPCQCCECQGKKCIAPHPGHSHQTGEIVADFMDRFRKASTPTQRLHNLVDSLGRCDRCEAETLDDPVVLCQACAAQQPPSPGAQDHATMCRCGHALHPWHTPRLESGGDACGFQNCDCRMPAPVPASEPSVVCAVCGGRGGMHVRRACTGTFSAEPLASIDHATEAE